MKEKLALLHKLQQTDSQISADQAELAGLDEGAELTAQLEHERAEVEEHQENVAATQAQLHDQQLQLQGAEDDRQRKWDQTYGGTVSDPKELSALEQKIEELDRRKDKLEEDIIMLLDDVENMQAVAAEKQTELDGLSGSLARTQQHFAQRSAELEAELEHLARQRQELIEQIAPSLLVEYDRFRRRISDLAVSVVEGKTCSACHTAVAGSLLGELEAPLRVVKCESCRRILVLDRWVEG